MVNERTPVALPGIVFSRWVRWPDRASLAGVHLPGVYLLAHFDGAPSGQADPVSEEIVYVGETSTKLQRRWRQFEKAASTGEGRHSGGKTYYAEFRGVRKDLYVSAFAVGPMDLNAPIRDAFIKYVERKLILKYALTHGIRPRFNKE